jgi:hypothetical protein
MTWKMPFEPLKGGRTSIGVRQNLVCWFKGAIKMARFTPRVLRQEELLRP